MKNNVIIKRDDQNRPHCLNGPAITDDSGSFAWYYHGRLHRTDGPAVCLMEKGCIIEEQFWNNGTEIK